MPRIKKMRSPWFEDIEESVYSEDSRASLVENDELTPLEEAFMLGWEEAEESEEA